MKRVLALRGVAHSGKSQTIRKVYELLCDVYPDARQTHLILRSDGRVILTTADGRLGIEGQGDPSGRLPASIALFKSNDCRAIVCATRTRGHTVDVVKHLAPDYEVIWFNQASVVAPESSQRDANVATAHRFVEGVLESMRA